MIKSEALQAASIAAFAIALVPLILALMWRVTGTSFGDGVLQAAARAIDALNHRIGRSVMWLTLALVLVQTVIVVLRYVFGEGRVYLQESMLYMNGMLFLLAAGYTLLRDGHVRVDIFYRPATPRTKAIVDVAGAYLFLFPSVILLFAVSFPYVRQSWRVGEASREAAGIPFVYGLKSLILVFCVLLFLQGLSLTIHNLRRLTGREPYPLPPEAKAA